LSYSGTRISISNCADYQALTRGVDDGGGDRDELIDFQNSPDLREEPMKQSEIPASYADDSGQTFVVKLSMASGVSKETLLEHHR
jgi:hypothetical protein